MKCPKCGNEDLFTVAGVMSFGASISVKAGVAAAEEHLLERAAEDFEDNPAMIDPCHVICDACTEEGGEEHFGGFPPEWKDIPRYTLYSDVDLKKK